MVPVPGIIRGTRGLRITRKIEMLVLHVPRITFYTRTRKLKNKVTSRRGKKGPFLNLQKNLHNKRPTAAKISYTVYRTTPHVPVITTSASINTFGAPDSVDQV